MKRNLLLSAQRATLGALLLVGLGACSSGPPLFLSDGRATTLVQCPAGSDSCAQQAAASCGGAFDTVRQSTDNGTLNLIYACRTK